MQPEVESGSAVVTEVTPSKPKLPTQAAAKSDLQPILDYLQSQQGHEMASRLLAVIEDIKKSTLNKTTSHAAFEKWLQAGIIGIVVLAASTLAFLGKFDTSLGVLFGTLVGYVFGKK